MSLFPILKGPPHFSSYFSSQSPSHQVSSQFSFPVSSQTWAATCIRHSSRNIPFPPPPVLTSRGVTLPSMAVVSKTRQGWGEIGHKERMMWRRMERSTPCWESFYRAPDLSNRPGFGTCCIVHVIIKSTYAVQWFSVRVVHKEVHIVNWNSIHIYPEVSSIEFNLTST